MKAAGVRELKNRLSEYLRRVRSGETVLVTDRGQVIAEIVPPGHTSTDASLPAGLRALAARGLATLGAAAGDDARYPALPRRRRRRLRSAADLLNEERGDR